jgi:FtsH-binding integral membrane protein
VLGIGKSGLNCSVTEKREGTVLGTILIVFLILALVGALPRWSHSQSWGYYPTGGLGLVLLIVVVLVLIGRL